MTEKQLFYPLLSVYFSLILGDLQKEKLQIVSIFRFGHKKGTFFSALGRVGEGLRGGWTDFRVGWGGTICGSLSLPTQKSFAPVPSFLAAVEAKP